MLEGLPKRLVRLLEEPPPAGVWVPAVLSDAVFHIVVDRRYPDEEALLRWTHLRTVSMVEKPMYRALVRVAGPGIFLKMGARVHGLIQKGTSMSVTLDRKRAEIVESFPPFLHSHLVLLSNVALLRGLIEITGGENVSALMTAEAPEEACYECTWT